MAKPFQALLFRGYTISIIIVHVPGQQMWLSVGPWLESKCSKTVEMDVHVKSQTLSARDRHWQSLREKTKRAQQYKGARVSAGCLSATQMA